MRALTQNLRNELAKVHNAGPWFDLWRIQIDATDVASTWTALVMHSSEVVFGGVTYRPWPVGRTDIEFDGEGSLPSCTLMVGAFNRISAGWAEIGAGFRGRPVELRTVHSAHLASANDQVPWVWTVAGLTISDNGIALDLRTQPWFDAQIPEDTFSELRCGWVYKGEVCRYTGSLGACARDYAACVARGDEEEARFSPRLHPNQFGAFPGISSGIIR